MRKLLAGTTSLAVVVLAAASMASALASAATPVGPLDGAELTTSYPLFRWRVPSNELAEAIFVARLPETTLDGGFPPENVVVSRRLAAEDTTWRPSRGLRAGR